MATCTVCGRAPAPNETISGRTLCQRCYREHVTYAGAGAAMVDGASPGSAVGRGLAAGRWAGSIDAEIEASRRRRAKLDATTGFWRRLWVRIWG